MWGAMKGTKIARAGLLTASLMASALATGAQAQEGVLVKNFLAAIGVIDGDKEQINYRERAPLVLPPRMDLREPVQPGSAQARNPQWPNDPDVEARNRQAAEDRLPVTDTEVRRMNNKNARLSIEEMRSGRRAGAEVPNAPVARAGDNAWIHPDILRAQDRRNRTAEVTADDSTRRSLTDPPSAYRKSATGQPIRGSFDVQTRENDADPKVFLRQQQMRNQQ
jgi:hypothetical protein